MSRKEEFSDNYNFMSVCMLSWFSHVQFFMTPWTVACQDSLSLGFSRQEYWSGLPCPPPRDLLNPGIEPESLTSPVLVSRFFTTSTEGFSWVLFHTGHSHDHLLESSSCTTSKPPPKEVQFSLFPSLCKAMHSVPVTQSMNLTRQYKTKILRNEHEHGHYGRALRRNFQCSLIQMCGFGF